MVFPGGGCRSECVPILFEFVIKSLFRIIQSLMDLSIRLRVFDSFVVGVLLTICW